MRPRTAFGAGLAAMAALTLLFWTTDLDRRGPALGYRPAAPHWPLARWGPCWILNTVGPWAGWALVAAATVAGGWSLRAPGRRAWRVASLQILLVAALGPGLLVNGVFKNLMGRPRPYETTLFGGAHPFLRPFEPGIPFTGSSFMSGHAAMAFLFVGLFFVLRGPKRWGALGGGLLLGVLVGGARVLRGDHFPSDVLLPGALDFTLAAALAGLVPPAPEAPEPPHEPCLQAGRPAA